MFSREEAADVVEKKKKTFLAGTKQTSSVTYDCDSGSSLASICTSWLLKEAKFCHF